jgi:predicted solute-binding protein
MNERIKELALEAKLRPALLLHYYRTIHGLTDTEQEELEQIEKFAELIVRECAQFTDSNISKFILKHFEIKK